MSGNWSFEKLCSDISGMSKAEIKSRLLQFHGRPRLDFTEDFLEQQPLDKLRHILFSVLITDMRKHA
jgi:hypothetical protein